MKSKETVFESPVGCVHVLEFDYVIVSVGGQGQYNSMEERQFLKQFSAIKEPLNVEPDHCLAFHLTTISGLVLNIASTFEHLENYMTFAHIC